MRKRRGSRWPESASGKLAVARSACFASKSATHKGVISTLSRRFPDGVLWRPEFPFMHVGKAFCSAMLSELRYLRVEVQGEQSNESGLVREARACSLVPPFLTRNV